MVLKSFAAIDHGRYLFHDLWSDPQIPACKKIFSFCALQLLYPGFFFLHDCIDYLWLPDFYTEIQYCRHAADEQEFFLYFNPGFSGRGACQFR